MKIAVMGTGAMGGYVGARLSEAGAEVTFIARGPHLAAMRQDGLKVTSPEGDIHINPVSATDDPDGVGPMDLILLGVKLFDVEKAVNDLRPMLGPDTGVISLQNGIDTPGVISRVAGPQHNVPGIAMINGEIAAPGLIQHNAMNELIVGEPDGRASPRMTALEELGGNSALNLVISTDIEAQLWRKVLGLTPAAGLSCLTRLPLGRVRETPESWDLLQEAMAEVVAVAQAEGIGLGEIDIQSVSASVKEFMPPTWRGSLVTDLEAGRRLEVEWLHGAIYRLGKKHGIDTPFHRVVLGALMPYANGAA